MKTQTLSPEGIHALNDLVKQVYQDLSDLANTRFFVARRTELQDPVTKEVQLIDAILDTVDENRLIINSIAGSAVVYAIWVRTLSTCEPSISYIGHVAAKGARTRMINHFVRKDPRTGAQLGKVRAALAAGCEVGLSFVSIDPAEVRLYVEEMLIQQHKPLWNIKSAERRKKAAGQETQPVY